MKIMFFIPSLGGGGAEKMFVKIINWFVNYFKNIDIVVVLVCSRGKNFCYLPAKRIKIIELKCDNLKYSFYKVYKCIKSERPDVVFSTIMQMNVILAFCKVCSKKFKLIVRETNILSDELITLGYPNWFLRVYVLAFRQYDKVIFQSADMYLDCQNIVGNLTSFKNKTIVINNCIDFVAKPLEFSKSNSEDKKHVLLIGRLHKQKGFDLLIDEIAKMSKINFIIDIYGDGPDYDLLSLKINEYGLDGIINLKGFVNKLDDVFKNYDLFMLTSRHEGFPNSMLEAISRGLPVYSIDCKGGINEIISPINGRIFKSIREMLINLNDFSSIDYSNYDIYIDAKNRFSENKIASNYCDIFKEFIVEKKSPDFFWN